MRDELHFFGKIELEKAPYITGVNVVAETVEQAMSIYEEYCNRIGGYIINLYPMSNSRNRDLFGSLSAVSKTIYAHSIREEA